MVRARVCLVAGAKCVARRATGRGCSAHPDCWTPLRCWRPGSEPPLYRWEGHQWSQTDPGGRGATQVLMMICTGKQSQHKLIPLHVWGEWKHFILEAYRSHWRATAAFAFTGLCLSHSTRLPALLQCKHTFRYSHFFLLFKNTPHRSNNADNDPSWQGELDLCGLQKGRRGKKYLKQVTSGGSWNNWCWAQALVPCGVVIEPRWLWHKDNQAGRKIGRQPAMIVCGKVNVYTLATHVEPMCLLRNASSSASHIRVGEKMGGRRGREKKKHSLEGGQLFP